MKHKNGVMEKIFEFQVYIIFIIIIIVSYIAALYIVEQRYYIKNNISNDNTSIINNQNATYFKINYSGYLIATYKPSRTLTIIADEVSIKDRSITINWNDTFIDIKMIDVLIFNISGVEYTYIKKR